MKKQILRHIWVWIIKNKCKQVGIHAFRRTVNSKMRCEGVSATVAAALLGHSPDVNEQYYTYDISDIKEKIRIVSKINAEIPIAKWAIILKILRILRKK